MAFVSVANTLDSHGVPLRDPEEEIDRAVTLAAGSTKPVYLASSGQTYPATFVYLADHRISLKVFDDTDTFVAPVDDGTPTICLTSDPSQPASQLLQQRFANQRVATVPYPGLSDGFALYRLGSGVASQLLQRAGLAGGWGVPAERRRPASNPPGRWHDDPTAAARTDQSGGALSRGPPVDIPGPRW